MYMKALLAPALLALLFCACSPSTAPVEISDEDRLNANTFYPLTVGNWWKTVDPTTQAEISTYRVTEHLRLDGYLYAHVENASVRDSHTYDSYYRIDDIGRVFERYGDLPHV